MQTYRTAQQMVGIIFEKYSTVYFSNAIEEYRQEQLTKEKFLEILDGYSRENQQMRDEINDFFAEKLKRTKTLTRQEVCEVNSEMLPGEIEDILRDQSKRTTKKAEAEARKAAKKAEIEAKKVAKKAETEAKKEEKKAAKKAEAEAKKAAKKADAEAKKAAKKTETRAKNVKEPVLESFARDQEILKRTQERVSKSFVENVISTAMDHVVENEDLFGDASPRTPPSAETIVFETPRAQSEEIVFETPTMQVVTDIPETHDAPSEEIETKKKRREPKVPRGKKEKETEKEEPYIITDHLLKDTKNKTTYFLRETQVATKDGSTKQEMRVFTKDKMIGSWKEDHIEFYNLGIEEVKKMLITPQMCASLEENQEYYISGDCVIYINAEGDILGIYRAETDTVEEDIESDDENDGELSEDDYNED